MTHTDENGPGGLTVKEICVILRTSKNCGVTSLKFGGLEVEFKPTLALTDSIESSVHKLRMPSPEGEISDTQREEFNDKALLQDELDFRKEQLAMALIEDPALAEQLIADGDLEDDESGSDDDSE